VRRKTLAVDVGIAAAIAVLVLIISPGAAITGMIAIFVLVVCAVSFALDSRARRARRARRSARGSGPMRGSRR
jgi:hypothetical protein